MTDFMIFGKLIRCNPIGKGRSLPGFRTGHVERLLCAALVLCVQQTLSAAVYYVATNGNNGNPGSATQPWLTVQKAANTMVAGDTVIVGSGTFNERVTTVRDGSSGQPITFQGSTGTIMGGFDNYNGFNNIEGFTLHGYNDGNSAVIYRLTAHDCVVRSNLFIQVPTNCAHIGMVHGSWATAPSNITITGNRFMDSAFNCMFLQGSGHLISSNWFEKTAATISNPDSDGDLMHLNASNVRFIGNTVTNWDRKSPTSHCDLVQSFSMSGEISTNNLIEGNSYYNGVGTQLGVITDDGGHHNIAHWTIRNNLYVNIESYLYVCAPFIDFYNNTYVNCGTTPLFIRDYNGGSTGHDLNIFNNIFYHCGSGGSQNGTGWWSINDPSGVMCTNIFTGGNLVVGTGSGTTKVGFTNGINGLDPMFVSTNNNDYRLTAGSPAIGTATNLNSSFTTDIKGMTRGPVWDIGACQFSTKGASSKPPAPDGLKAVGPR